MFKQNVLCFITVVETGSFTAAGKRLLMSQSAVSQHVDKLEKELNIKLFNRSTYRPTLTTAGQYYYTSCRDLLSQYNKTLNYLATIDNRKYTIGITSRFEKKHLPSIIQDFKKETDQNIDIQFFELGQCTQALMNHKIDIAFDLMNNLQHENIHSHSIYNVQVCAICSPQHPFSNLKEIDIHQLKDEPVIILSKAFGTHFYHDFLDSFKKDGVQPHIIKEVNSLEELIMSVSLNEGIAFTSLEVLNSDDDVHPLLLKNSHHHASIGIGYYESNDSHFNLLIQKIIKHF